MATHEARSYKRIRFRTETGSIYEVIRGHAGMRWRRLSSTLGSGPLRTEGASLLTWPQIVVGERCSLWSKPYIPGIPREVHTSMVVAVLQRQDGETPGRGRRIFRGTPAHRRRRAGAPSGQSALATASPGSSAVRPWSCA